MDRRDNNFDLLRLLAAWLVLFSHSYPIAGQIMSDPFARTIGIDTLGGIGVSIFFVLSGYLVTQSWLRSTSLTSFVWKRARRIYPALVVCVLISTFAVGPMLSTLTWRAYFAHEQMLTYTLTATAWDIHYVLPGVFGNNALAHVFNGSLWSLPYEIGCYLALLAVALLPFALRWKVLLATTVLALMLLARPLSPPASPLDVEYGLDMHMVRLGLFFSIGAIFQCWSGLHKLRWQMGAISVVALLGAVAATTLPESPAKTLLWIVSFASFALSVALGLSWLPKLPEAMGDWSYGLYLYAFPMQQILSHLGIVKSLGFVPYVALCTVSTMACAALSWYLVERPALRLQWWR